MYGRSSPISALFENYQTISVSFRHCAGPFSVRQARSGRSLSICTFTSSLRLFFVWKRRAPWLILVPIASLFGQTPLRLLYGAVQADRVGRGLFSFWLAAAAIY
jgi:hypothetical protein